jgi:hypothetical protein
MGLRTVTAPVAALWVTTEKDTPFMHLMPKERTRMRSPILYWFMATCLKSPSAARGAQLTVGRSGSQPSVHALTNCASTLGAKRRMRVESMSGHSQKAKELESEYSHELRQLESRTRIEKAVPSRFASPQFAKVMPSSPRSTHLGMSGVAPMVR